MSYNYYQEEINSLPANDPDGFGLAIQIRHEGTGAHTKWLSLTDECKDVLRKFITASPDPDGMNDSERAHMWEAKYRELQKSEETYREELANYLKDPICPATWTHIVGAIRELILFRDCAKKANNDPALACAEFLLLARRRMS